VLGPARLGVDAESRTEPSPSDLGAHASVARERNEAKRDEQHQRERADEERNESEDGRQAHGAEARASPSVWQGS
jgi:hypothetical protein